MKLKLLEKTLAIQKVLLGLDHPDTLRSMVGLGNSYAALGRLDDALKLREQTLALQQARFGRTMVPAGQFTAAEPLLRDTLRHARSALGPSNHTTIVCLMHMIVWLNANHRHDEAVTFARELFYATKGSDLDAGEVAELSDWWGGKLTQIGRYADARQPLLDALDLMKARGMSNHPKAKKVMLMLATGCDAVGNHAEATEWRQPADAMKLPTW